MLAGLRSLSCALLLTAMADVAQAAPYSWRNAEIQGGGFVSGVIYHPAQRGLVYLRTDVGGVYRQAAPDQPWAPLTDGLGRVDNALMGALSLAVDPHDPARLYVAAGEYSSTWARNAALLVSADRGDSWRTVALPFKLGGNEDGRSTGERLQVDPNQGRILVLGTTHDGLWRSGDRGRTWSRLRGFTPGAVTLVVFQDAAGKSGQPSPVIYAGAAVAGGPGLYRSEDGGEHWSAVAGQPMGLIPHHAAFDSDGALYVTYGDHLGPNGVTTGAVWKLDTRTGAWREITPVKPGSPSTDTFGYAGLAVDPRHPGTLVVSTLDRWVAGDEIFRSRDGGASWSAIGRQAHRDVGTAAWVTTQGGEPVTVGHWIGDFEIDPFDPDDALYVTGYGVWRTGNLTSADAGQPTDWRFADKGLDETVPLDLASPPAGPHLISALGDIGGFIHDDPPAQGRQDRPHGTTNRGVDFAALAPAVMARTSDQAPTRGFISADGGASWRPFGSAPAIALASGAESGRIALTADGRAMIWAPSRAALYVSTDGGDSWRPSQGGPPAGEASYAPAADRVNPAKAYVYDPAAGVAYVSTDGGQTFHPGARELPPGGGQASATPGREGEVWLPTPTGLYRSTDSANSFAALPSVSEAWAVAFGKAAPGRDHPAVFLWGRAGSVEGLFRSDDAGAHWQRINDDAHRYGGLRGMAGDPRVFGRLYLATDGRGIVVGEPAQIPSTSQDRSHP
ncbi:MAG TPA: hypothetical protein VF459_18500 [Caulobacteraceae bacterium]